MEGVKERFGGRETPLPCTHHRTGNLQSVSIDLTKVSPPSPILYELLNYTSLLDLVLPTLNTNDTLLPLLRLIPLLVTTTATTATTTVTTVDSPVVIVNEEDNWV